jgi:glycosyltransferase involved in cell wall biosynthesis
MVQNFKNKDYVKVSSSQNPLVSIVCPTYNSASYLRETINSVLAQTYRHWELILADDGSTDATVSVISDYLNKHERIQLIQLEHKGIPAITRNAAAFAAEGDYLAFLDSDDPWLPTKLEKQVAFFIDNPEFEACHTSFFLTGDPQAVDHWTHIWQWHYKPIITATEILHHGIINTSTLMMRTNLFRLLGGFDEDPRLRSGEDQLFDVRLALRHPIGFLPEKLGTIQLTPASVTRGKPPDEMYQGLLLLEKLEALGVNLEKRTKNLKLANIYYTRAINSLYNYQRPFRADFALAVRYDPWDIKKIITLSCCFLPATLLRPWLSFLLKVKNAWAPRLLK